MTARERFHRLLRQEFFPLLRAAGFRGKGTTFTRQVGPRLDVVNVQGSVYGGQCCVNLGVHFTFLPTPVGGLVTDPTRLRDYDCEFHDRLHGAREGDFWWSYGGSDAEARRQVRHLVRLFERRGHAFFARFEPFPAVFEAITPEQVEAGDLAGYPVPEPTLWVALTLARIMRHLGRTRRARQFAAVGLRHVGDIEEVRAELEQLRKG
jgi:hypothetical protein